MNPRDSIAIRRLIHQRLLQPALQTPAEVVRWMGAIQSQDFLGSLWAIGCRMQGASEKIVEQAIAERSIVRLWPMRGTLHFVPAEDAGWMVKLMASRAITRMQSVYRKAGLDEEVFAHSREVFVRALEGGRQRTRKDLYDQLEAHKIDSGNGRGLQIIGRLAFEGLICFGPRQDKQPTFALLEEWIPVARKLEGETALAEMVLRYFRSHGPATVRDFVWWTGLRMEEALVGLQAIKPHLIEETIAGETYRWAETATDVPVDSPALFLLPAYDEYLVSYKDRSAMLNPRYVRMMKAENHLRAIVVCDGQVIGNWKRTFKKGSVRIEVALSRDLSGRERELFEQVARGYGKFLGLPVEM